MRIGSRGSWTACPIKNWKTRKLIFLWAIFCFLSFVPSARSQIPATSFGMHIQSGVLSSQPWPSVPIGGMRLWDTDTTWYELEPSKGIYNWSTLDGYLSLAQAHNIDVLYTFGGTPLWGASGSSPNCGYAPVNPGSCYPPTNIQDWDNFVTALVVHSAGKIKYWEVWNEANLSEYWTGDVPTLATLAQHAYKIIKAANPNAVVLSPSSTGAATDIGNFLNTYFSSGGLPYSDGVAFHGYVNYNGPSAPEGVLDLLTAVKISMASFGIAGKPIWDTEGSWGLDINLPNSVNQQGYLARQFLVQLSAGVSRFYWYAWNDTATGTLWTTSSGIQPAAVAYGQVYNWIVGATISNPCTMASNSTWTCTLTRSGGYQAVAIWNSAATTSYTPATQYKQYRDLAGHTNSVNGSVAIGYNPILLVSSAPVAPPTNVKVTVQ